MARMSLVCTLKGQCSGICGEVCGMAFSMPSAVSFCMDTAIFLVNYINLITLPGSRDWLETVVRLL